MKKKNRCSKISKWLAIGMAMLMLMSVCLSCSGKSNEAEHPDLSALSPEEVYEALKSEQHYVVEWTAENSGIVNLRYEVDGQKLFVQNGDWNWYVDYASGIRYFQEDGLWCTDVIDDKSFIEYIESRWHQYYGDEYYEGELVTFLFDDDNWSQSEKGTYSVSEQKIAEFNKQEDVRKLLKAEMKVEGEAFVFDIEFETNLEPHNSEIKITFCDTKVDLPTPDVINEVKDEQFVYSVVDDHLIVKKYIGNATVVKIPNEYDGKPVTHIGDNAFFNCSKLTKITIPDSVTCIGVEAFGQCSGLTKVTIPDSVTSIGESAFSFCSGLTEVTIPDSVISIGGYAFAWCSELTKITISNSVTSIGEGSFKGCIGLTEITIPDSVTNIGYSVFSRCTGLTEITIPDSVTSIGEYAFEGCDNLTDIYCEADSQPDGWDEDWQTNWSGTIHWGHIG